MSSQAIVLPRPTFFHIEEDGTIHMEWVDDNIRISLYINQNPLEAWEAIKTTDEGQDSVVGFKDVSDKIIEWLEK